MPQRRVQRQRKKPTANFWPESFIHAPITYPRVHYARLRNTRQTDCWEKKKKTRPYRERHVTGPKTVCIKIALAQINSDIWGTTDGDGGLK